MRALLVLLMPVCLACGGQAPAEDDCQRAQAVFQDCGVTLALLDAECAGPARAIAQCVLDVAESCDALALLDYDECLTEPAGAKGP